MIHISHMTKRFKDRVIFEDASAQITKQKTKIEGTNGTGKSVLLKMIVGYSEPDEGSVTVDNIVIGKTCDFLPDAGVSINAPEFVPYWTGKENLKYLQDILKKCSDERLNCLIRAMELEADINKKYRTYSLGMKQKMRLIQALMDSPKYLILDEPFDALDTAMKKQVKQMLDDYLKEDRTRMLIYTSHIEDDEDYSDDILYLSDRKLVQKKDL